jgi:hypothetical protein
MLPKPLRKPWTVDLALSELNLAPIAQALLDVRYQTVREMSTPLDCAFTRETAVFGRQRNMLIQMALSPSNAMQLVHAGMDVTFAIGGNPIRFFTDDPEAPNKHGFFKRNSFDSLFSDDEDMPVIWRFVVEPALTDDEEDRGHFVGYNAFQEKVSQWTYGDRRGGLTSVGGLVPPIVPIAPAEVGFKHDDKGDGQKSGSDER